MPASGFANVLRQESPQLRLGQEDERSAPFLDWEGLKAERGLLFGELLPCLVFFLSLSLLSLFPLSFFAQPFFSLFPAFSFSSLEISLVLC